RAHARRALPAASQVRRSADLLDDDVSSRNESLITRFVFDDDAPRALAQTCEFTDEWTGERCRAITLSTLCTRHRRRNDDMQRARGRAPAVPESGGAGDGQVRASPTGEAAADPGPSDGAGE